MKNGKVFAKLALDKRVARLTIGSASATITLADNCYVETGKDRVSNYALVKTAKEAEAFIRSATVLPKAPEGQHYVRNLMTGKPVLEADGTPYTASVASESYWSA